MIETVDLGRMGYEAAYAQQERHHAEVLASREAGGELLGRVLIVEHDPVITVTRRPAAPGHVLAPPATLAARGIDLQETDRGGDVTYHGPGQAVIYPILDIRRLGVGLHEHVRMLEGAVISAIARFGVEGSRDAGATGVWIQRPRGGGPAAKIAAIGVRVRRWITLHGLALNVRTDLDHFALIVPCGLAGRPVTSLERELGPACPGLGDAASAVAEDLRRAIAARRG